jgi:hypothetical protein
VSVELGCELGCEVGCEVGYELGCELGCDWGCELSVELGYELWQVQRVAHLTEYVECEAADCWAVPQAADEEESENVSFLPLGVESEVVETYSGVALATDEEENESMSFLVVEREAVEVAPAADEQVNESVSFVPLVVASEADH